MSNKDFRQRRCPVCDNSQHNKLYEQRFSTFSGITFLQGYDVVVCSKCGFGYADNIPAQYDFDLYYKQMSKYENRTNDGHESPLDADRYADTAYYIDQHILNKEIKILEIGCSTGGLLHCLKRCGFKNVMGLDPSPYCSKVTWELFGISVVTGTISSFINEDTYDLVILVGVIEHIVDLIESLNIITHILSPYGMIYLEVPDVKRFHLYPDAPFQQFSIEHINYFSLTSLSYLMHRYDFELCNYTLDAKAQSEIQIMPVINAIFRNKQSNIETSSYMRIKDFETKNALISYIQQSLNTEKHINHVIDNIVKEKTPIVVWGTGTHTMRLLAAGSLAKANILAFFDSNPKYIGGRFKNISVLSPEELHNYSYPVLISSRVFQNEIVKQIRNQLKCNNELIFLY